MRPLISVVIPAYNVEPFIEEAIRSIMNQTYENLEIIVVDDASTDHTYQILQKLAAIDYRIKLFRNEKNKRIVETLNFGIEQVTGPYIVRMDGDDVSLPTKIEAQYNFLINNPDIDLVGINVTMIDEAGKKIHDEEYISDPEGIKEASKYVSPVGHFWLTKTSIYRSIGNYRIPSAEDLDFLLRAIDRGYKLYNLPKYLYLQRQRRGNTATALGLTQIKSIGYVRRLHKERVTRGIMEDSYTPANYKKALETSRLEKTTFNIASKFHYKYIQYKNRSKLTALIYRLLAILFSPVYQLRPIYNRWQYKKLKQRLQTKTNSV
jgi:glycosyltransferase involved in cell wall biosynthesis